MQQSDLRSRLQRGADWMRRGIDPNAAGMEPEIAAGMQRLEEVHDAQRGHGAHSRSKGTIRAAGIGNGLELAWKSCVTRWALFLVMHKVASRASKDKREAKGNRQARVSRVKMGAVRLVAQVLQG